MKAAVYDRFGGPEVVRIADVPKPVPGPDEVLIRVLASTVSVADYRMRTRDLPKGLWFFGPLVLGVFRPRKSVLGMDLAGVVEAVGAGVSRFKPGDEVIAMPGARFGGHAEYRCMAESAAIALKPANLTHGEAVALVFGGETALRYLRFAGIKSGDSVLVNGASGAVGSAAVQLARHFGATVTAVSSGVNEALVRGLGADRFIDYTTQDFTRNGETYDIIVECVGNAPFRRVEGSLRPGGRLLLVLADLGSMLTAGWYTRRTGKKVILGDAQPTGEELSFLAGLAESGALRPVVDSEFPLRDIVAAHRRLDTGRKRGNIVLEIADPAGR